ncbi:MAG: hypothetical protein KDA66_15360 [Planctomycetaceae bacterium]|nr:hypothetical protein [Planctomycetaceae bacterium]
MRICREEAIGIAMNYAKAIGASASRMDYCGFDDAVNPPVWRVFLGYDEEFEEANPLIDYLTICVDAATGEASHVQSL